MNYETAKKLKDAGFEIKNPQRYSDGIPITVDDGNFPCKEAYFIPPLSELIEACGEDFGTLCKSRTNWMALNSIGAENIIQAIGSTAEIAVANLWLELNK